jgi:hypothetical protein
VLAAYPGDASAWNNLGNTQAGKHAAAAAAAATTTFTTTTTTNNNNNTLGKAALVTMDTPFDKPPIPFHPPLPILAGGFRRLG